MGILTDEQAEHVISYCVPHKVIIDGEGLGAIASAICDFATTYKDTIESDPASLLAATDLARWLQKCENEGTMHLLLLSEAIAKAEKTKKG